MWRCVDRGMGLGISAREPGVAMHESQSCSVP